MEKLKPEKQAKQLMDKMHLFTSGDVGNGDLVGANAKQCALICVDKILKNIFLCTMMF